MKSLYFCLFILLSLFCKAQVPLVWINHDLKADYSTNRPSNSILDASGNIYVVLSKEDEYYDKSYSFGFQINKFSGQNGSLLWNMDFKQKVNIASIKSDSQNNFYIAGYFLDTLTIQTKTVYSRGKKDFFLSKFGPDGTIQWLVNDGGPNNDQATGLAIYQDSLLYVTGSFRDQAIFNGTQINSVSPSVFLAFYNTNGNFKFLKFWKTEPNDSFSYYDSSYSCIRLKDIQIDKKGNLYGLLRIAFLKLKNDFGDTLSSVEDDGDGGYYLIKIDSSFNFNKKFALGSNYTKIFTDLMIADNQIFMMIGDSWKYYIHSNISSFDGNLGQKKSINLRYNYQSSCDVDYTNFNGLGFNKKTHLLCSGGTSCFDYSGTQYQYDHFRINILDSSGLTQSTFAFPSKDISNQNYFVLNDSINDFFYTIGYSYSGLKILSDSILPGQLFILKLLDTASVSCKTIFKLDTTLCWTSNPFQLKEGNPAGGTFSGKGVKGNLFDPKQAGVGKHNIVYSYTNASGCVSSAVSTIEVTLCSGINDLSMNKVQVFPNPSTGKITLKGIQEIRNPGIRITDLLGRIVLETKPSSEVLDISNFRSGIYFLEITGVNFKEVKKVVLK